MGARPISVFDGPYFGQPGYFGDILTRVQELFLGAKLPAGLPFELAPEE